MSKFFPNELKIGSKGIDVRMLQIVLKAGNFDPEHKIVIDDNYGENTAEAVKRVQRSLRIEPTGEWNNHTQTVYCVHYMISIPDLVKLFPGETQTA